MESLIMLIKLNVFLSNCYVYNLRAISDPFVLCGYQSVKQSVIVSTCPPAQVRPVLGMLIQLISLTKFLKNNMRVDFTPHYLSSARNNDSLTSLEVQLFQHDLTFDERLQRHAFVGVRQYVQ